MTGATVPSGQRLLAHQTHIGDMMELFAQSS